MTHSDERDPGRLWQRVRDRLATAVRGRLPEPPTDLQLLRVSCEVAPAALRPLLEARRLTEAILGEARPKPPDRSKSLRRRTLFGEAPERATEAVLVELWNHLSQQTGSKWVVVFDAVEQADEATLAALTQIVRRQGWLQLPLVLVFHGEPKEAAAELLLAVRTRDPAGVVRGEEPPSGEAQAIQWRTLPPEVLRVLRAGALIGPGFETRIVADLLSLEPLVVLELMQQATDLGIPVEDRGEGRFSLPTSALTALSTSLMPSLAQAWHRKLGRLLGARAGEEAAGAKPPRPPAPKGKARAKMPSAAQVAEIIDLSAEVVDLVDETGLAAQVASEMAAETGFNNQHPRDEATLADGAGEIGAASDMSGGTGESPAADSAQVSEGPGDGVPRAGGPAWTVPAKGERSGPIERSLGASSLAGLRAADASVSEETGPNEQAEAKPASWSPARRKTIFAAPAAEARAEEADPAGWGAPSRVVPTRLEDPLVDEARAAEHMRLAGEFDEAAQHLCEAARKAAEMGAPQAAAQHAQNALSLLATLPSSATRRLLRVQALIELGRLQWQSAGYEFGFTLTQAQATLDTARAELGADEPVELAADLAQAIAGVCFDLGDARSLERAHAELVAAGSMLQAAGDATGAACLLNDQAAVLVRMGDPGRALQLLRQSRKVFDPHVNSDPVALRELAETEHLFARLPLQAQLRAGRELEGFEMGLEHARAAERAYRDLGEVRELGRVWETMGRLELRAGRTEVAKQRFDAAAEVQTQLGDLTGLAQTTEALSQVLAQLGRDAEAVTLLRDSVVFNRDKGSPRGLQQNRRVFTELSERLAQRSEHAAGLQEVAILLSAGERELGALLQPPV
ncbi:tetratricopeptide repeat protein [Nannocystis punicea]|uniref:Tetratricopeptide repeat protein n=1 Tax=Nannocystis punicea TaxID=2995304 RepID=A0ABY7H3A4_9BACT|nr:tetratricopeptide repeat protein [Nannocystis poenicansa]WAS93565.1 tetratricopeptide repeat protein [Nannocystis poenicansa]